MKKIKSFFLATLAFALVAPTFTSCKKDEANNNNSNSQVVQNIMSEFTVNDQIVAKQKAASGKNEAVLLVAFGSTWNNAFLAFDQTKKAYETAFPIPAARYRCCQVRENLRAVAAGHPW